VDHGGAPPQEARTPIPEGELDNVLDPGAAFLALVDQVGRGEGCGGSWRLFDGVRRMNLQVVDEGREQLAADRPWTYEGPARRCRLRLSRVGGFPVDSPREAPEEAYDRILWIAPMPEGATPVRLSVDWPLGRAVGRIDLRGRDPAS
jgi:hypothetical protein